MSQNDDAQAPKTASEKLAEVVSRRKAAQAQGARGIPGQRQAERAASAQSLSRSRPASRKS